MTDTTIKTFTQDEVNDLIAKRLERERAKFADYADLKAKADAADAAQSEIAKLTAAVNRLTADAEASARQTLINKVAREHKISDQADVELFLTGADEATLVKQAQALQAKMEASSAQSKRQALVVPNEGSPTQQPGDGTSAELRTLAHTLFGGEPTG